MLKIFPDRSNPEQQTEFHVSVRVTIAKLSALIRTYKKERDLHPCEVSTDLFSSNATTSIKMKLSKLQLPPLIGSLLPE